MIRGIVLLLSGSMAIGLPVGCGENESLVEARVDESPSIAKPQFIKQVDEVCETEEFLNPLLAYIRRHANSNQSEGEIAADGLRKIILPEFQEQIEKIRRLKAPAGDGGEVTAFLAAMQEGVDSLRGKASVSLASDVDMAFERANELARTYGFRDCVN